MAFRKTFNFAQMGAASVWDTGVPATSIRAGLTEIQWGTNDEVRTTDELRGELYASSGADILGLQGVGVLTGYTNYTDLAYPLQGAYGAVSPSADAGTPIAYTRVYTPAGTTDDTPLLQTLELGSSAASGEQYQIPTALPLNFELTGAPRDFLRITENWWGSQLKRQARTGSLSRRTVARIAAGTLEFWIDDASGTIGTTPVSDCITEVRFNSGTLYEPKNCLSAGLIATGFTEAPIQPTMQLTLQAGALSETLFDNFQTATKKYVRMKATGTTPIHGSVFPSFQVDLAAQIMAWPNTGNTEAQGGITVQITFTGVSDTGSFSGVRYTLVNAASTIP